MPGETETTEVQQTEAQPASESVASDGPVNAERLASLAKGRREAREADRQPANKPKGKKAEESDKKPDAKPDAKPEETAEAKPAETKEDKKTEETEAETKDGKPKVTKRDVNEGWAKLKQAERNGKRRSAELDGRESRLAERETAAGAWDNRIAELKELVKKDPVKFVEELDINPADFARGYVERQKADANLTPEERARKESTAEVHKLNARIEELESGQVKSAEAGKKKSKDNYDQSIIDVVRNEFEKTLSEDGETDYPSIHFDVADQEKVIEAGAERFQEHWDKTGVKLTADELFEWLEAQVIEAKGDGEPTDYSKRRALALSKRNGGSVTREKDAGPENGQGTARADKSPETVTNRMAAAKKSGKRVEEPKTAAERRARTLQAMSGMTGMHFGPG